MNRPVKQWLFWTPRVLAILFTAFLSLFSLDVFGEGYGFWGTMLALVMHLVPTMIVLTALVIAWRWEAAGGILLIALGVWYLTSWPRFHWSAYLVISGPLILTGGLCLAGCAYRAMLRPCR
jgi:hypothetical protein